MNKEVVYFQLFLKDTDLLYYENKTVSVIIRAYEMYEFKQNLELRIVTKVESL